MYVYIYMVSSTYFFRIPLPCFQQRKLYRPLLGLHFSWHFTRCNTLCNTHYTLPAHTVTHTAIHTATHPMQVTQTCPCLHVCRIFLLLLCYFCYTVWVSSYPATHSASHSLQLPQTWTVSPCFQNYFVVVMLCLFYYVVVVLYEL